MLRIDVLPEEEKLLLHLRIEGPDSGHEGPDAGIVTCLSNLLPNYPSLALFVSAQRVPLQDGCTAVPERGLRTGEEKI